MKRLLSRITSAEEKRQSPYLQNNRGNHISVTKAEIKERAYRYVGQLRVC
jgi:hypothetical protein